MKINLPDNAKIILDTIHQAGYEAYVVGGCVRDAVLGRIPGDWDITTNALPQDIKKLFRRTIDTGIEHGTVTVMMGKEGYEVTTYRIDGKYEDNRHPSEVTFTKNLTEDMKRRDFTINAMAYSEEEGLIDRFGGIEDIKKGLIRCVGEPRERFSEDALRIMRAIRFSAQLDYSIEEKTKEAIKELSPTLEKISAERIQVELVKLLLSDHPEKMRDAYELGITKVILPEFDACMETDQNNIHHAYSVGEHIIKAMEEIRPDRVLRLTMLMHDMAKPATITVDEEGISHFHGHDVEGVKMAKDIFRRLKFDRDTMDKVCNLILHHDERFEATPRNVRRAMNRVGVDAFNDWLEVRHADTLAQSEFAREDKLRDIEDIRALYEEILREKECVTLKDLAVNGKDLIELGVTPGKTIGNILSNMLLDVLDNPEHNTREYLLEPERLRDFMRDH
ncbi:CCA tRNA nucleotidyltransferase [Butyrivibrio sp. XBB1001]|uniref:CCA tRNA nucleotidyltransferase n=1 Tax=Butyrivibrio sp. XBB1001 TaxID=1280682 RepID=UPI0003F96256|nr:CCA tRNA nucleotidyltransferase [Butyrivibrio sp. XBB1001]